MSDRTIERVDYIIKHIEVVLNDTKDSSLDDLKGNELLLRATCFSIAQIGEVMSKLKELIGDRYPNIPWLDAKSMRNVIVHDYQKVMVQQVYSTIKNDLPALKKAFEEVKRDLMN